MGKRIVAFLFFANYFVGFLAVALSVETVFQLGLLRNSFAYYLLLFSVTVFYYTFAYSVPETHVLSANPRTEWYRQHARFIRKSQLVFLGIAALCGAWILQENLVRVIHLPFYYWLLLVPIPLAAILYYGLTPESFFKINLRRTGWWKAFVIGFVWAGCVNLFPVTMLRIEHDISIQEPVLMLWLFMKNWMFCTVNAIMFDIKDYEDDANIELKTFAVRFGLNHTIFRILIPLLLTGISAFLIFAFNRNFSLPTILFNLIPFICLLIVAFQLQRPRRILYYLIVIDGLLLVKAVCGIAGSFFK